MAQGTFSREYLRNLPMEHRRLQINNMLQHIVQEIQMKAKCGGHLYILDCDKFLKGAPTTCPPTGITITDILEAVISKFPGCKINYKEDWVETSINTRTFTKAIHIDWS